MGSGGLGQVGQGRSGNPSQLKEQASARAGLIIKPSSRTIRPQGGFKQPRRSLVPCQINLAKAIQPPSRLNRATQWQTRTDATCQ